MAGLWRSPPGSCPLSLQAENAANLETLQRVQAFSFPFVRQVGASLVAVVKPGRQNSGIVFEMKLTGSFVRGKNPIRGFVLLSTFSLSLCDTFRICLPQTESKQTDVKKLKKRERERAREKKKIKIKKILYLYV